MSAPVSLRLTPLDVALFRDARPFSADDSTGARLQSPLPPQLGMLGALRHLLLFKQKLSFQDFRGGIGDLDAEDRKAVGATPTSPGTLRIGPVSLAIQKDGYAEATYTLPSDLVFLKKGRGRDSQLSFHVPREVADVRTSMPEGCALLAPARFGVNEAAGLRWVRPEDEYSIDSKAEECTLPSSSLPGYLLANTTPAAWSGHNAFLGVEKRIGIERSPESFTAVDGKLYTAEFVRPMFERSFYTVSIYEGASTLPRGKTVMPVGGESRPFEIEADPGVRTLPSESRQMVREALLSQAYCADGPLLFRLYLLSHAPPGNGPKRGWAPWLPEVAEAGLEIYAAAVSRPKWISGWITDDGVNDGKTRGGNPRDARPYIPAGSVFFVRATARDGVERETLVDAILERFWNRPSLCDLARADGKFDFLAGHGFTLVGVVPSVKD